MTGFTKPRAPQHYGPLTWTGRRQGRALRRVNAVSADRPLGVADLEREALVQCRLVVAALMTPGHRFPTRRQLSRAWKAVRALDLAEAAQRQTTPGVEE